MILIPNGGTRVPLSNLWMLVLAIRNDDVTAAAKVAKRKFGVFERFFLNI